MKMKKTSSSQIIIINEGIEQEVQKQSLYFGNKGIKLQILMLFAVFAVAFLIRASAYTLPGDKVQDKPYFQDEAGDPYMTEMDSYFYLRKAEEMAEGDGIAAYVDRDADPLIGQRTYDRAEGVSIPLGLSALTFLLWKYILSGLGISMRQTAIWLGPALGALAMLPAYFYVRKRTSPAGGITAALLAAWAVPFVVHTHAGFYDTDLALGVLPLTAVLSLMRCLQAPALKKQAGWALLSAASLGALALFWRAFSGYWLLAAACSLICVLLSAFLPRSVAPKERKSGCRTMLAGSGLFLALSMALLFAAGGTNAIRSLLNAAKEFSFSQGDTGAMPYHLAFTSEMKTQPFFPADGLRNWLIANTGSVLGRIGGIIPFLLALCGIPAGIALKRREQKYYPEREESGSFAALLTETVFLGVWAAAGLRLACRGRRYAEIPVLPICVLAGLAAGRLYGVIRQRLRARRLIAWAACAVILLGAALPVCYGAWKSVQKAGPMINDSKQDAYSWIRNNTPEDTAIASWWDDGYYMQYQGRRRSLADGGTDSGAVSMFLAKALLTDNPDLMAGILRMLNESGTDALDRLTMLDREPAEALELLLKILPLPAEEAGKALREEGLPQDLLQKTHPENPNPLVLSLSPDLLAKCGAIAYFAFWDPAAREQKEKAYAYTSTASAEMKDGSLKLKMSNKKYKVYLQEDSEGRITGQY